MNLFEYYLTSHFELLLIFCSLGVVVSCMIIISLFSVFFIWVKEKIQKLKRRYIIKHRFDKPPIAQCYCIDCKLKSQGNNQGLFCYRRERYVADNWFCWEATPDFTKKENK